MNETLIKFGIFLADFIWAAVMCYTPVRDHKHLQRLTRTSCLWSKKNLFNVLFIDFLDWLMIIRHLHAGII